MMRSTVFTALFVSAFGAASAQVPAANTDIYLAPITRIGDSIVVGRPVDITPRVGYDNQPSFTPDSRSILYTAQSDGQTDIWRYDIGSRATKRVTSTPESEYSPTVMPGGKRFSVIRVERDSTQRLWSFLMNGTAPQLVLRDLKPVGYHAWLDATRLVTYVLGTPSTLRLVETKTQHDTVIARDVGRSIALLPAGTNALFSFTQRDAAGKLQVYIFRGETQTIRYGHRTVAIAGHEARPTRVTTVVDSAATIAEPPYRVTSAAADNEFQAWTTDGIMLTASGTQLLRWNAQLPAADAWLPVASLAPFGVTHVTRLALSPDGRWLAFVAEPAR